jgi:hypothetical protein
MEDVKKPKRPTLDSVKLKYEKVKYDPKRISNVARKYWAKPRWVRYIKHINWKQVCRKAAHMGGDREMR